MDFNIFGSTPEYYSGLLGQEATDKLRKRATGTGIANALLALVAQPRNQGYGSALPYIGKALMAGQQAGQNVVQGGLRDFDAQQRIAEMKRKQEQQQALQGMIGGITDPNERLFATLSPEQYVASKVKPAESPFAKINPKDFTAESINVFSQTKNAADLVPVTELPKMTEEPVRLAYEMFGKPINQLTPEEVGRVNNRIEQSRVKVAGAGVLSQSPGFKDAGELRKEYNALPEIKAFKEVQNAFDQINTGLSSDSAAGDITAATKFMKLLDPGSVVRESELAIAMGATGLWDRATNYYEMLKRGVKLTPTQRQDFKNVAQELYSAARIRKQQTESFYSDIANQGGLNPNLVISNPVSENNLNSRIANELKKRKK